MHFRIRQCEPEVSIDVPQMIGRMKVKAGLKAQLIATQIRIGKAAMNSGKVTSLDRIFCPNQLLFRSVSLELTARKPDSKCRVSCVRAAVSYLSIGIHGGAACKAPPSPKLPFQKFLYRARGAKQQQQRHRRTNLGRIMSFSPIRYNNAEKIDGIPYDKNQPRKRCESVVGIFYQ